ncbi:hypothetical protein [Arthrobacter sp. B0490]|uniref:hypothetical protein n=1 Tax=Arthrobacter sp. B0490 TaxID=2058891 RepID=UPI002156F9B4|nr:hypothetical protein [Arthrobacter sp. B0490]
MRDFPSLPSESYLMANLPARLLDVLRCPVTGSKLVQEGPVLRSTAPGPDGGTLTYGLDEGIPVLLRAELLEGAATS